MAEVQLSPLVGKLKMRNLPYDLIDEICALLNRPGRHNYRYLAAQMELTWEDVLRIDATKNPTASLLEAWWTSPGNETIQQFVQILQKAQRFDIIEEIKNPKYYGFLSCKNVSHQSSRARTDNRALVNSVRSTGVCEQNGRSLNVRQQLKEPVEHSLRQSLLVAPVSGSIKLSSPTAYRNERHPEVVRTLVKIPGEACLNSSARVTRPQIVAEGATERKISLLSSSDIKLPYKRRNDSVKPISKLLDQSLFGGCENIYSEMPTSIARVTSLVCTERSEVSPASPRNMHLPISCAPSNKLALIIGNRYYKHAKACKNLVLPHRDAFDFSKVLTELNFQVLSFADLSLEEMRVAMLNFSRLAAPGAICVFYYAGHGFESGGVNYLMPVDAQKECIAQCFAAQEMLQEMQKMCSLLNLLILDTCRLKMKKASKKCPPELAYSHRTSANSIVAYACAKNMPALEVPLQRNGVYMTALLRYIKSDRRIESILLDVNKEVNANSQSTQNPSFVTDSVHEVRLTSNIDESSRRLFYPPEKSVTWWKAMTPPRRRRVLSQCGVLFDINFLCIFGNILQIDLSMCNQSEHLIRHIRYTISVCSPLETQTKPFLLELQADNEFYHACDFRIWNLQCMEETLLVVLEIVFQLHDSTFEPVEIKLDLGYPLASEVFHQFREYLNV